MKEQDKATARDLSKTGKSNMTDREFKLIIIDILIEVEKKVEDFNETLNRDIRNNIAEIKSSINKIRKKMLDRIDSRQKEAEKSINDLEDRVME